MHEAELQMCLRPPLCPPGLVYPTDSEFISRLRELEKNDKQGEQIPLIPSTVKELEDMLKLCCFTPINLPRPVQIQIKSLYRLHTTSYTVHYKDTSAATCAYTSILQRVLLLQYFGNTDWHSCVCVCVCCQAIRGLLDNRIPNNGFYKEGQSAHTDHQHCLNVLSLFKLISQKFSDVRLALYLASWGLPCFLIINTSS